MNDVQVLRGAAALKDMLDTIGSTEMDGGGDHAVAKILVEHELELSELFKFVLKTLAKE